MGTNKRVITGGADGQVRVWQITKQSQTMVASLKDHRAQVNKIRVRENDTECVSASNDGSCIIYNLQVYKRAASLQASTFFKSILYHPDESQILTAGGDFFVSGGADKLVKVWHYDEGMCRFIGVGHSGSINRLAISPDQGICVSVGAEGAICIWAMGVEAEA